MRGHQGLHPHIGALDVCPVVWQAEDRHDDAVAAARQAAEGIGALGVPVFLYGELASEPGARRARLLPQRRPGRAVAADEVRRARPDLGPGRAASERRRHAGHRAGAAGRLQRGARHPEPGDRARRSPPSCARRAADCPGYGRSACRARASAPRSRSNVHDPCAVPLGDGRRRDRPAGGRARRPR